MILRAWLQDRWLEPSDPPDPVEWSEGAGNAGYLPPSLGWWVTLPKNLDRVWDALISLFLGSRRWRGVFLSGTKCLWESAEAG